MGRVEEDDEDVGLDATGSIVVGGGAVENDGKDNDGLLLSTNGGSYANGSHANTGGLFDLGVADVN